MQQLHFNCQIGNYIVNLFNPHRCDLILLRSLALTLIDVAPTQVAFSAICCVAVLAIIVLIWHLL